MYIYLQRVSKSSKAALEYILPKLSVVVYLRVRQCTGSGSGRSEERWIMKESFYFFIIFLQGSCKGFVV